jgi:serine/threonine protein kinase
MRILEQLGPCTYRIWDPQAGRERVLKAWGTGDGAATAMALGAVSHPNVVGATKIVDYLGKPHLLRDWVAGTPLDRFSPTPDQARALLSEIDSALRDLHRSKRVHGRVHPGNIIVTPDGHAVLVDGGLPRVAPVLESPRVRFLSPARLRGQAPSYAADRFAFGVIGYRLLARQYPHEGADGLALASSILYAPVARLDRSFAQAELVETALGLKRPRRRPGRRTLALAVALAAGIAVAGVWQVLSDSDARVTKRGHRSSRNHFRTGR